MDLDHTSKGPIIVWLRRDLRLSDHPALHAARQTGRAILPVFILDDLTSNMGAAPLFRLGLSLGAMDRQLRALGSRLLLRQGQAEGVLRTLIAQTGAGSVFWSRLYDPASIERDSAIKSHLRAEGIEAHSFTGHLLFEPYSVETKSGGPYRRFTPFWRTISTRDPGEVLPPPGDLVAPEKWPASDHLEQWELEAPMRRGADVVRPHCCVGEENAQSRLDEFLQNALPGYVSGRDYLAFAATSGLSENLTYGEISPRQIWWAAQRRLNEGSSGAEAFLRQLAWREFAYHLLYHYPDLPRACWRPEWGRFPWSSDDRSEAFRAWSMGQTGQDLVDAGMRELWSTGVMHNRVRMVAASYLCKHLLIDWRLGLRWFEDQLIDWDPASNALNWQWAAGCGPDAAPYFRIFNPETQVKKYDPNGEYIARFKGPDDAGSPLSARDYYRAIPASCLDRARSPRSEPIIGLREGRARALAAYEGYRNDP